MTVLLRFSDEGRVAHLHISRPERRNAIDLDTMETLSKHLDELEKSPQLIAVVLSTAGSEAFIAGGDLKSLQALSSEAQAQEMSLHMGQNLARLEALSAIVIAAVDGYAYGGGCEILLACDLCIANQDAVFGFTQIRFSLSPGWGGATRLAQIVGKRRALHLQLTGAVLNAAEALTLDIITEVTQESALSRAEELAREMALKSPLAIQGLKKMFNLGIQHQAEQIRAEREIFAKLWASEDHAEAVSAFFEKRPPKWKMK